ncbi:DUF6932 family protein, partial [Isoptericola hypogeus]|uniref:DUF6932 family protein n=1 Tax=Isoptericola hypogeus TaxID=300179 RepID=UPI003CD05827
MIPELTAGGHLPLGRHHTTLEAIATRFVRDDRFAASARRPRVWSDFERALSALRTIVPPCAVWIGGSFVTAKLEPDDIDVTWILPRDRVNALPVGSKERGRLGLFAGEKRLIAKGIMVDSYTASWAPYADEDAKLTDLGYLQIAAQRGYWDDWWQRLRADGAVSHPSSSVPRRGYL